MRFPIARTNVSKTSSIIDTFRGLNQNLITADGEWSSMKNISDRFFPAIASRPARGETEATMTDPKGILYKNGLFYIDGTKAYYKGVEKFTVSEGKKNIVGMGAYVCIFPDGIIYNTFKDEVEHITASASYSATFAPLSEKSVFTKITATGINNTFHKGDAVKIDGYDGNYHIISDEGENYITISGARTETETKDITVSRNLPEMDFVAEKDNRLWGCSSDNHEVYCCKVGDPKNWYAYETGADMAWAATVGSDGDFTGLSKLSTYMLFFKENTVHILRGDKPANFSLTEKSLPGVRKGCDRSVQIINDVLYYVGRDGVYAFDGSLPQRISNNITVPITDAVSSTHDGKLYISCKMDGSQTLLVYDTRLGIWMIEDETLFRYASYSDGMLHYVGADNNLHKLYGDSDETIMWSLESGDIQENMLDQKYISKIKANIWLEAGTEMYVYMKFDDEPIWRRKGYIRSTKNKTYTLPIRPNRCGKYRIRFEGTGQFKLLAMSKEVEKGSEINGSLQHQFVR